MISVVKAMGYGAILAIVVAVLALSAFVRLAPSDPAVWNIAISDGSPAVAGRCVDQIRPQRNGARVTCLLPDPPATVLSKLAAIAATAARTSLLAGTPDSGRMTWIGRSRLMGFPDYITGEVVPVAEGSRLDIFARQRFGGADWGVNAARLTAWLAQL
ncbi:MAG: DUF1499 domain-containing protein [bacterium]